MLRRLGSLIALAGAAGALAPAGAAAHPSLIQAAPAPGVVAPDPPEAIELALNENVVVAGSRIELSELAGEPIETDELERVSDGTGLTTKPAEPLTEGVYEVRWSALGADGHVISGRFAFGVAGSKGEPPDDVQALIAYGSRGGPGEQEAATESIFVAFARWLALACAAFLLGGWVLLARLERAKPRLEDARLAVGFDRWRALAPPVWLLLLLAASGGLLAAAAAGVGDQLDLGTALDSATGRGAAVELAILIVLSPVLLLAGGRPRVRDALLAVGGLTVLVAEALNGHVQTLDEAKGLAAFVQIVHVASAGIWFGGLLALLVIARRGEAADGPSLAPAARAFAPLAAGALGVSVLTGVISALREVDDLYFLLFSSYGNVVIAKTALVALAAAIGAYVFVRSRRRGEPRTRALGAETGAIAAVVVLAAVLAGLVPGRDQVLPAEDGNLLPGPALASSVTDAGPLRVTLAPALPGSNLISLVAEPPPGKSAVEEAKRATVQLQCDCAPEPVEATLERGEEGVWQAEVELPAEGSWYARAELDGRQGSAVALPVGVPEARGSEPLEVLAVADLTGADAARCRSHLLGLELAIGRLNALGGLDGGRKLTLLALDDGGSAEAAAAVAERAIAENDVVALAGACGDDASGAVEAAAAAGVPSIVADPGPDPVPGERVFRLAGDPYAEGFAQAQFIEEVVAPSAASDTVTALRTGEPDNERLLEGLARGLDGSKIELEEFEPDALSGDSAALRDLFDAANSAAVVLDGESPGLAAQLRSLGEDRLDFTNALVLTSSATLSERLITSSGAIGRTGAVAGVSEVLPDSAIAQAYSRAVPALFPGERPSLDGLRGYLAGLALEEGVKDGIEPDQIAARLREPAPFADALIAPWRSDAPAAGSQRFAVLQPSFLPATLVPTASGGQSFDGTYFTDGAWTRASGDPLGPPLEEPVPPLVDTG